MKKLLAIVMSTVMTVLMIPFAPVSSVFADTTASGTAGNSVTWSLDSAGVLTFSGSGAIYDYEFQDIKPYEKESASIKKIVVSNGITRIGDNAFQYLQAAESVSLPGSIESIGDYAFAYCLELKKIDIPAGVKIIGDNAFSSCRSLSSINIPASVHTIGESIFSDDTDLETVTVDSQNPYYDSRNQCNAVIDSVNKILIAGCKKSTVPSGVAEIAPSSFAGCATLKEITLPASVISIGTNAFMNCSSLERIEIMPSVTSIGYYAFHECTELTIAGIKGSYAETYAANNGIDFEQISIADKFPDISMCNATAKTAIAWASDMGIVRGFSDGTFGPEKTCTRMQMMIMLWRMAGEPEPADINSAMRFKDSGEFNASGKRAIAWGVENAIVKGYTEADGDYFRPSGNVTRAQTVIMMWRMAGTPIVMMTAANFTDIGELSQGALNAINWAAEEGITAGIRQSDGTYKFGPNDNCQRQQIAIFVFKFYPKY